MYCFSIPLTIRSQRQQRYYWFLWCLDLCTWSAPLVLKTWPQKNTGNRDSSNMMSLNVWLYIRPTPFLSTHLAYPCSSLAFGTTIFTERHHWFHLLVQTFHISVVGYFVCKSKHFFTFYLYQFIFNENIFVHGKLFCSWSVVCWFGLGFLLCWLWRDFCLFSVWFPVRPFSCRSSAKTRKESRFPWYIFASPR